MPFNQQSTNVGVQGSTGKDRYKMYDTNPAQTPNEVGTVFWDVANSTLALKLFVDTVTPANSVTLQIGQEMFLYAKNSSGVAISNGQACSLTNLGGSMNTIQLTDCTNDNLAKGFVGLATQDIAINAFGYVTISGVVNDVNTNSFTEGAPVYVNPASPGNLTATEPSGGNYHIVQAGICEYKQSQHGRIQVISDVIPKLSQLSDVDGVAIDTTGQIMVYNATTHTWSASQIVTATVRATGTADDSHLPTEKAVRDAIGGSGYVPEAPSDSKYYARYNASWQELIIVT